MYCEKIEQAGNSVYGKLVELAFIRGIEVYEIECPELVLGIYHDYQDEGIDTKAIMAGAALIGRLLYNDRRVGKVDFEKYR